MYNNRESKMKFRKIKSLKFEWEINEDGSIVRNIKSKHTCSIHKQGFYKAVYINNYGQRLIHHLVAEAWLGPKPEDCEIDHKDRNKYNNHYTNLRYVTHSDNCKNVPEAETNRRIKQVKAMQKIGSDAGAIAVSNPVKWNNIYFNSIQEAIKYITKLKNCNPNTLRGYFTKRRKFIQGAETEYYTPIVNRY